MESKLFEIRDRATFIPILAVRLTPASEAERYLLARSGYGLDPDYQGAYVILCRIVGGASQAHTTPDAWGRGQGTRTLSTAHHYIINNWEELTSGDVVDVEFILGETSEPKVSERLE